MNTRAIIGLAALTGVAIVVVLILRKRMASASWQWPAYGRISSPFGPRVAPISGASTNHNGIDIAVPVGTEVRAPKDGTVLSVYTNAAGGKQLVVEHEGGWRTGYAHLSEWKVSAGDKVAQGQVIALSGNTGNSGGPHLHFTLTNGLGTKVDPMKYLA